MRPAGKALSTMSSNNQMNGNPKLKIYDPVQVYCRVRPLDRDENENCIKINDETSLTLSPPESALWKTAVAKELTYSFQRVYNDTVGQKTLSDEVAIPLVKVFSTQ